MLSPVIPAVVTSVGVRAGARLARQQRAGVPAHRGGEDGPDGDAASVRAPRLPAAPLGVLRGDGDATSQRLRPRLPVAAAGAPPSPAAAAARTPAVGREAPAGSCRADLTRCHLASVARSALTGIPISQWSDKFRPSFRPDATGFYTQYTLLCCGVTHIVSHITTNVGFAR